MKQMKEIITKNEMGTVVARSALPCLPGDEVYLLYNDKNIVTATVEEVRLCKDGQVRFLLSSILPQFQNSSVTIYKNIDDFGKSVFTNKSGAKTINQKKSVSRELRSKFDYLEKDGFSEFFWGNHRHRQFTGKKFRVVNRVYAAEHKGAIPRPIWKIRFMDGIEIAAYQEEIIPSCMKENGCPERYYADSFQYEADKQIINAFKEDFLTGIDSVENLLNNYKDYVTLSPSDKANLIRWSGDCSYMIDQQGTLRKYKHTEEDENKEVLKCLFSTLLETLPKTPNRFLWTDGKEILCSDYERTRSLVSTISKMLPPNLSNQITMGFYTPYADREKDEYTGYHYIRIK